LLLAGESDNIVVHHNIRLSLLRVSDILDSDHVKVVFLILDLDETNKLLEPLEKFTVWERFRSLASNFISPRSEVNLGAEADKTTREFTVSIALGYWLSTRNVKLYELHHDHLGVDRLLSTRRG
jgi:hypothetical protein